MDPSGGGVTFWEVVTISALVAGAGLIFYFGRWTREVDSARTQFENFMKRMETTIEAIHRNLDVLAATVQQPATRRGSPTELTELGEDIADRLDAHEWAARYAANHAESLAGFREFEVDARAKMFVEGALTPGAQMKERAAEAAYFFGVDEEEVRAVLNVVLRQALLHRIKRLSH